MKAIFGRLGLRGSAAWALAWLCAGGLGFAAAAEPGTAPQPRVVQDMHTAPIGQIRADAAFQRLYTVSADKTLRIWRLTDLRLLRTVNLPSEPGLEGTPHGLAVSRDGRRVYVAGVTGWAWDRAAHVYVVDADLGLISGSVGTFDNDAVVSLDLSPDGRRLAVGLARGGLRWVDADTGAPLASDEAYAAPVGFVHFANDGRLASTSADGCVRVYGPDMVLALRSQYPPVPPGQPHCTGSELGGIRFSPDGRWLAFGVRSPADGDRQRPEVLLLDAGTLQVRRVLRALDPGQRSLCCVAWSPDSAALFVNGHVEGDAPVPLYRVQDPLSGGMERWDPGLSQDIANMLPLPQGELIVATAAPVLARIDASGRIRRDPSGQPVRRAPDNIDFHGRRADLGALRVSPDGRTVLLAGGDGVWRQARLGLDVPLSQVVSPGDAAGEPGAGLRPALRSGGAVTVETATGLHAYREPVRVNGKPVSMDREESVWSWAVHASRPIAALGTQWRLRLVDAAGKPLPHWEQPPYLTAAAYRTVITADGRMVVVALGDGSLRWYGVDSGRELLGLFLHANGTDWVAWREDGFYASSPHGDRHVGWLVNRGARASPDLFRAVQFERQLYRPDLIRLALQAPAVGRGAGRAELAAALRRMAAPRVRIESLQPGPEPGALAVRVSAEATGRPLRELGVYVDGVPVLAAAERAVAAAQAKQVTRTFTVRAPWRSGAGSVRVEAETDASLGIDETLPLAAVPPRPAGRAGRLWVVAVGVAHSDEGLACEARNDCKVRVPRLPNTRNDAQELAAVLQRQAGKLFDEVHAVVLAGGAGASAPTRANLVAQMKALEGAAADDTVLVFVASHGFTPDPASGEYYFMTQDTSQADLAALLSARPGRRLPAGTGHSLFSGTELHALLKRVPGRRVLVVDTCHSGSADGRADPYALFKRSAAAQIAVLSASQGDQESFEVPQNTAGTAPRHGVFTYALLEALSGKKAAAPVSGPKAPHPAGVTLQEAFEYVGPRVAELLESLQRGAGPTARHGNPQTPMLTANPALADSPLAVP